MTSHSRTFRSLSIVAGMGMVVVGASVTLSHVHEPDQRALVVAMAAGAAFGAFALPTLWGRHRGLAILALLGIVLGEAYGLAQTVERILNVREERARVVATENQPHAILKDRVKWLRDEVKTADKAVLDEAGNGGCKKACIDKKKLAEEARQRLEQAERELAAMPVPKGEAKLAAKLGVPSDLVDVVLASIVSVALLCFQLAFLALGHGRRDEVVAAPVVAETQPAEALTRHEAAAEFARAYKAKHGHPPRWAEVKAAGFSPATASRALRLVK